MPKLELGHEHAGNGTDPVEIEDAIRRSGAGGKRAVASAVDASPQHRRRARPFPPTPFRLPPPRRCPPARYL